MATPEKFIEQIVHGAHRVIPANARPECLFFGFSEPFLDLQGRAEKQAAVLYYQLGSIVTYRLYVSDTFEATGYLGSGSDIAYPKTLEESIKPRIIVPGCIPEEYATVELDGSVGVTVGGEAFRPDRHYKEQLASKLALLTIEC